MSRTLVTGLGTLALALAAPLAAAAPAGAATGGPRLEKNPGIVALTDASGHQVCSAVLVAPTWALTFEGPMTCAGAEMATGDSHDHVRVIDKVYPPNADPGRTQAMLVHLDKPVQRVAPAKLDTTPPKKGETLKIVAFNGPEGINHLLSVGASDITVKGHNAWISWYGKPKNMTLATGLDSGDLIMRGDKVVAFTGLATATSVDAEDIANIAGWVKKTTRQK